MRNHRYSLFPVFFFTVFVLLSCDNPVVFTPGSQSKITTTGITITDATSPQPVGVWGNPISNSTYNIGGIETPDSLAWRYPDRLTLETPYPNPADGSQALTFSIPRTVKVKAWAETAYLPFTVTLPVRKNYQQKYQRIVLFERIFEPGYYVQIINLRSKCAGGDMEQGFYRLFLLVDDKYLLFQDTYIGGDSRIAPDGLDNKNSHYHPCDSDYPF